MTMTEMTTERGLMGFQWELSRKEKSGEAVTPGIKQVQEGVTCL